MEQNQANVKPKPVGWYDYRIMNLRPEVPQGHEFRSRVPDLDMRPELWESECPYHIDNIEGLEVIKEAE